MILGRDLGKQGIRQGKTDEMKNNLERDLVSTEIKRCKKEKRKRKNRERVDKIKIEIKTQCKNRNCSKTNTQACDVIIKCNNKITVSHSTGYTKIIPYLLYNLCRGIPCIR